MPSPVLDADTTDAFTYDEECGHHLVDVAGELQHHNIPDDFAPHVPTSECGCGPALHVVAGHVVYEHVDQDAGVDDDD